MSRAAKRAKRYFSKVQELQSATGAAAVGARKELKRMRDVWYNTDKRTTAGEYWNPDGKRLAKGSSGKHKRIMSGQSARNNQARGL